MTEGRSSEGPQHRGGLDSRIPAGAESGWLIGRAASNRRSQQITNWSESESCANNQSVRSDMCSLPELIADSQGKKREDEWLANRIVMNIVQTCLRIRQQRVGCIGRREFGKGSEERKASVSV